MTGVLKGAWTATAITTLALSSSVWAQPKPNKAPQAQSCFFRRDISSFSAPNDHTVLLRVGVNDYYKLDVTACSNLDFALRVELRPYRGEVAICSPLDAELVVRLSGAIPDHCPIQAMHKLTPAEVALLGKNKP
jgi:hypothetical protein